MTYKKRNLEKFELIVNQSLKVQVTQNMFDAMVSHTYNCRTNEKKTGNIFILVFGIVFPIIMSILTVKVFLNGVPKSGMLIAKTSVFIALRKNKRGSHTSN